MKLKKLKAPKNQKSSNASAIRGLFSGLKNSNLLAHQKATSSSGPSDYQMQSIRLLREIASNTELLLKPKKEKSNFLTKLLTGLGGLLLPMFSGGIARLGLGLGKKILQAMAMKNVAGAVGRGIGGIFGRGGKPKKGFLSKLGKVGKIGKIGALAGGIGMAGGLLKGSGTVLKSAGKIGGKLLPGVGLALGAGFAYDRFKKGDYLGALGEAVSGLTSLVPGIGTAASLAIQGGLMARDLSRKANSEAENTIIKTKDGMAELTDAQGKLVDKQNETIETFSSSISGMAKKATSAIGSGVSKMVKTLGDYGPTIIGIVGGGVGNIIKNMANFIPTLLNAVGAIAKNIGKKIYNFVSEPLSKIYNKIKSILPDIKLPSWQDMKDTAGGLYENSYAQSFVDRTGKVGNWLGRKVGLIDDNATKKNGGSSISLSGLYDAATPGQQKVMDGIGSGFRQVGGYVRNKAAQFGDFITNNESITLKQLEDSKLYRLSSGRYSSDNTVMDKFLAIESMGNAGARRRNSGGKLSQFIGLTQIGNAMRKQFGLSVEDSYDPHKNFAVAKKNALLNAKAFKKYGIPITATTLYLAHNQGLRGFLQIWNAAYNGGSLSARRKSNMRANGKQTDAKGFIEYWKKRVNKDYSTFKKHYGAGKYVPNSLPAGVGNSNSPIKNVDTISGPLEGVSSATKTPTISNANINGAKSKENNRIRFTAPKDSMGNRIARSAEQTTQDRKSVV